MRFLNERERLIIFALALVATSIPTATGQSGSRTIIYGDNSGSMRGFAEASGTRLAALYQLLVRELSDPQLHALADNKGQNAARPSAYFANRGSYAGNTDLVRAIASIREHEQQGALVTDGMQSEGLYADVKEQLKQMAGEGWGIWLFAMSFPFAGGIDSEQLIPLADYRSAIESCIQGQNPPATVDIPQKANRMYRYTGQRPILILLFYKETAAGRKQSLKLLAALQADPQFSPQVVELAPLVKRGVKFAEPRLVDLADAMRVDNFTSGTATIRSDTTDSKRLKELRIPIAWETDAPPLSQAMVEIPKYDAGRPGWLDTAPVTEEPQEGQDANRITGNVKITVINELGFFRRNFCWLPFVSCSSEQSDTTDISAWSDYVAPESSWWSRLSTDTSWQCPNKVYKLAELVSEVSFIAADRQNESSKPKHVSFKLIIGPL